MEHTIKEIFSFEDLKYPGEPNHLLRINNDTVITANSGTIIVISGDHEQRIKLGDYINAVLYRDGIIYAVVKQRDGFLNLHIYQLVDHELELQRIVELNILTGICFIDINSSTINVMHGMLNSNGGTITTIHCQDDIEITYEEGNKYIFTTRSRSTCFPFYIYKEYIIGYSNGDGIVVAPIDDIELYYVVGKVQSCVNYRNSWGHLRFAD